MKTIKKYFKNLLWLILSITISILILTSLYYFNIINSTAMSYLKIIIILINVYVHSYLIGKKSSKKGYLEGIKLSLSLILFFILLSIIMLAPIKINSFIYYLIIIITAILGSSMGINKSKK